MIDPATGEAKTHDLGEVVQNSFAVGDKNDVYIVSEAALYRFRADATGAPVVKWRKVYENTGEQKPGQVSAGRARRRRSTVTTGYRSRTTRTP